MARKKRRTKRREKDDVCCSCGYSGDKETACPARDDGTHTSGARPNTNVVGRIEERR